MLGQSSEISLDAKVESWDGPGRTDNEKPPQNILENSGKLVKSVKF